LSAGPAFACGGLVAPNGTVNLVKTTTLAAYSDGVEHYVTSFEFVGGGAKFGSIVPLPGIPSDVRKGGNWTLQRLVQEVQPPVRRDVAFLSAVEESATKDVEVLLETSIDALDITIVKGGGDGVGLWAKDQGFNLSPDSPEVLDFYARRSPVFMAVKFDPKRALARGQTKGDGTPVHLTIPTHSPWVPLRILGLGKQAPEQVTADVFLLTPNEPRLLPVPSEDIGMTLAASQLASDDLMADLRSDSRMGWLPETNMWLTYLKIDGPAGRLVYDLAIDPTGVGAPDPVAAGLVEPPALVDSVPPTAWWSWILAGLLGVVLLFGTNRMLSPGPVRRDPGNFGPWQSF